MKDQKELAARYFDEISDGYQQKYSARQILHEYIFKNRLNIAIARKPSMNGLVLDVGAGSGALYSELLQRDGEIEYMGCDISGGMLKASGIPPQQQFVGSCYQIEAFAGLKFDTIFMLGVTTYMDRDELENNLDFVSKSLAENGVFIVSFTNRLSVNRRMRASIKSIYKFFRGGRGKGVISQDFRTYAYRERDLAQLLESRFGELEKAEYYNFIFFPVSHLFKRFSVRLSGFISRYVPRPIKKYFAAEFIVACRPRR